jgi:uncharacterized protein (DUF1330 family)
MSAYIIAMVNVKDAEKYQEYAKRAGRPIPGTAAASSCAAARSRPSTTRLASTGSAPRTFT